MPGPSGVSRLEQATEKYVGKSSYCFLFCFVLFLLLFVVFMIVHTSTGALTIVETDRKFLHHFTLGKTTETFGCGRLWLLRNHVLAARRAAPPFGNCLTILLLFIIIITSILPPQPIV
jgi:hypothetical protein